MYIMVSFGLLKIGQKLLLIITTKQNKIKSNSAYSLVLEVNIKANINTFSYYWKFKTTLCLYNSKLLHK